MAKGDEVRHLRETINHREDHGLAAHPWKALHKVHGNVAPDMFRHGQGLKKTSWVQVLSLVALTHITALDEVMNELMRASVVEGRAQPMKSFMRSFMAGCMGLT